MAKLVIVESPAKARTIAGFLGAGLAFVATVLLLRAAGGLLRRMRRHDLHLRPRRSTVGV